jgi:hypothetical protein
MLIEKNKLGTTTCQNSNRPDSYKYCSLDIVPEGSMVNIFFLRAYMKLFTSHPVRFFCYKTQYDRESQEVKTFGTAFLPLSASFQSSVSC